MTSSMPQPAVVLESRVGDGPTCSYTFHRPSGSIVASSLDEVIPALQEVESAVEGGLHAAGFVSYEAAAGLDRGLVTAVADEFPLVWFGLFKDRQVVRPGLAISEDMVPAPEWHASLSRFDYYRAVRAIRGYIEAGDTYQVNFTYRLRAQFSGDDRALYGRLCQAQSSPYCAYVDLGRFRTLSASPELFFELRGGNLICRPMKGTRRRGHSEEEDLALARELRQSPKERAENVMIVDLMRNDMGKVSETGSVQVRELWGVERYETLWQMTSAIQSRLRRDVGLPELFTALFPCGSVTGVPKVRTMQIIAELEDRPRGIYTGSIGYVSPGSGYGASSFEARFNVAIRTILVDRERGIAEYGVGGGITWDSREEEEFEECEAKALVLSAGGSSRPRIALYPPSRETVAGLANTGGAAEPVVEKTSGDGLTNAQA